MDLKKTLHKLSYLKWIFLIALIILILYCFIVLPENLVRIIGIILFIAGIWLGLDSLSDISKMPQKEVIRYNNIKYVKQQSIAIISTIIVLVLISFLFLSLKFVFTSKNTLLFDDFFDFQMDIFPINMFFFVYSDKILHNKNFFYSLTKTGAPIIQFIFLSQINVAN